MAVSMMLQLLVSVVFLVAFFNVTCNAICQDGFYGQNCSQSCSVIPNCDICTKYTSLLSCNKCFANFTGDNCTERCSPNCKDDVCDKLYKTCFKGCKPGFFGDFCNKTCPDCSYGSCNQSSGNCENGCNNGRYGLRCNKNCSDMCKTDKAGNHLCNETGHCEDGCLPGFYGMTCNRRCPVNCGGNRTCNQASGICIEGCNDGYYGNMCIDKCNQNCSEPKKCDRQSGKCLSGCEIGLYGNTCDLVCSENCNETKCNQNDGKCENGCGNGFYGIFCNLTCNQNCGGKGHCYQDTGICANECKLGFYGPKCNTGCQSKCLTNKCNRDSGDCLDGCEDGFYGFQCLEKCSLHCSGVVCTKSTGQCPNGCSKGLYGPTCSELCKCKGNGCDQETGTCSTEPENMNSIISYSIAAFVLLIVVLVIAFWFGYRRRKQRKQTDKTSKSLRRSNPGYITNIYECDHDTNMGHNSTSIMKDIVDSAGMLIQKSQIINDKEIIGRGQFAEVRKGQLIGAPPNEFVAVKTIQALHTPKDFQDFQKELQIIGTIGTHPNVVELRGFFVGDADAIGVVLEYCPNGDLKTYVRKLKPPNDLDEQLRELVYNQFNKFAVDIASGMKYISQKGVIHRDLAARNVLLDANLVAKVSDFGLSRTQNTYVLRNKDVQLPIKWMAIESLRDHIFSTESDVWSFGIVVWEIYSLGATPFSGETANDILTKLSQGKRLQKPQSCPNEMYDIMTACWDVKPDNRPSFEILYERLVTYMNKLVTQESHYQTIPDQDNYSKINEDIRDDYENPVKRLDENMYTYYESGETTRLKSTLRENDENIARQSERTSYLEPLRIRKTKTEDITKPEHNEIMGCSDNLVKVEFRCENKPARNSHINSYLTPKETTDGLRAPDQNTTEANIYYIRN